MMNGMFRRFASIATGASLLALVGLSTAPASVSAATAAACTVSGSATISPGLGPVPGPQGTGFNGSVSCTGVAATAPIVLANGGFSGGVNCALGSIELGVECTINFTASVGSVTATCSGGVQAFVQVGPAVVEACVLTNGDVQAAVVVFVPSPAVQNPVVTVSFDGVSVVAGAA